MCIIIFNEFAGTGLVHRGAPLKGSERAGARQVDRQVLAAGSDRREQLTMLSSVSLIRSRVSIRQSVHTATAQLIAIILIAYYINSYYINSYYINSYYINSYSINRSCVPVKAVWSRFFASVVLIAINNNNNNNSY